MKNIYEVDNFNNMNKSPIIFFRYTIQMLTFLIAIYIVHLNFSLLNALFALLMLILSEMILEIIENMKYSRKIRKESSISRINSFIDRNFHYFVLVFAFCIRLFISYKLDILPKELYDIFIHILNFILGSIISLFIYLISKELFSKRTGQMVSVLYSMNIFLTAYGSICTKHNIFAVLILTATYLIISKKYMTINYIIKHCIIALILSIASIIRAEAIIYVVAVIVYLFANSLIKNNGKKEKLISIIILAMIYVLVNLLVIGLVKFDVIKKADVDSLVKYKEIFKKSEKSIGQFELNSKEFWSNLDYSFIEGINDAKIKTYDSAIQLFCTINAAMIIVYCKMKNIEDERMYLVFLIILINFFVYGFINDNSMYSYIAKITMYILASGGLAIVKKNAEIEAMEKYNVKLLQE